MSSRSITNPVPIFSAVRTQPVAKKSVVKRRRHVKNGIAILLVVTAFALVYVWTRIEVISLGYEVSRARKEVQDLSEQKSRLEAEVVSLKSPERLEPIAKEMFGMRLPESDEIVFLDARTDTGTEDAKVQAD